MSSLPFRRFLAQSSRARMRRSATSTLAGARRGMASDAHRKTSSDLPWLIGSGLVTAVGVTYILSPPSKKHAHEKAAAAAAPVEKALPPPEKQEEQQPAPEIVKDDEGTEADVSQSAEASFDADTPKDAKASEEGSTFENGAPGQTEEAHAEGKPEQKEKPSQKKRAGTLQDEPDGPTDLGDARKQSKEHKAPKEVAEATDS